MNTVFGIMTDKQTGIRWRVVGAVSYEAAWDAIYLCKVSGALGTTLADVLPYGTERILAIVKRIT